MPSSCLLACSLILSLILIAPPRTAAACVPEPSRIVYPLDRGTAPTNTRILGRGFGQGLEVRYVGGATIAGELVSYYHDRLEIYWIFRPEVPLVAGSTVGVSTWGDARSFVVGPGPDVTPPRLSGVPSGVVLGNVRFVSVESEPCDNLQAGDVRSEFSVRVPPAHDDSAPDDVLVYLTVKGYGAPGRFGAQFGYSCTSEHSAQPPGTVPCTQIAVEDPAGNAVLMPEICGTMVPERTVARRDGVCVPAPAPEDAGVPAADASGGNLDPDEQGCDCTTAEPAWPGAGLVLLLGATWRRRRGSV